MNVRPFLINGLTAVIALIVSLAVAEGAFRLWFGIPLVTDRPTVYRINSLGFRGPEPSLDRKSHSHRIALLGDSYGFGYGVAEDRIFSTMVEAGATARKLPPIAILNFSRMGWNTKAEAEFFLRQGRAYEHDRVALAITFNDVEEDSVTVDHQNLFLAVTQSVLLRSIAYGLSTLGKVRKGSAPSYDEALQRWYEDKEGKPWQQMRHAIAQLAAICRSEQKPLTILFFEVLAQDETGARAVAREAVRALAREIDVPFVTLPEVASEELPLYRVHALDGHPSAAAHALAADVFLTYLAREMADRTH